ncbi:MAG: hypothetical protein IKG82_06760 [Oscillospiraceae bacterium]|nr:hypothetical protein [Oscillospiraceae bacterium]
MIVAEKAKIFFWIPETGASAGVSLIIATCTPKVNEKTKKPPAHTGCRTRLLPKQTQYAIMNTAAKNKTQDHRNHP